MYLDYNITTQIFVEEKSIDYLLFPGKSIFAWGSLVLLNVINWLVTNN